MTAPACDRFAREGALGVERGTLDEVHVAGCADCRAAHAAYLALTRAVRDARPALQPPAGWEARVQARIAAAAAARRRARTRWILVGATALVAAAVLIVMLRARGGDAPVLALRHRVTAGAVAMRSDTARPGDRLHLEARAAAPAELRLYRLDGTLIARCAPDVPPTAAALCRRDGDQLHHEVVLPGAGRYRAVLLAGAWPAATTHTTGSFDADLAAAQADGVQVVIDEPLDVR